MTDSYKVSLKQTEKEEISDCFCIVGTDEGEVYEAYVSDKAIMEESNTILDLKWRQVSYIIIWNEVFANYCLDFRVR